MGMELYRFLIRANMSLGLLLFGIRQRYKAAEIVVIAGVVVRLS